MKCTDHCNHTFSCQIDRKTVTAGHVRWCTTVEVKDTLTQLINITFTSSSGCMICNNDLNNKCCGSDTMNDDTVTTINCSTHPPSSQSSTVTLPVNSVPLMGTHGHLSLSNTLFITSTTNTVSREPATPSSNVPVTSTIISVVVPAVATVLLCLMVAAVFGSILALVLCKTKRKQFPVTNNSDQISQQRYTS